MKDSGTIFKIKPDGTGYAKLLDFAGVIGGYPYGSLISDGIFLYGMTEIGGLSGTSIKSEYGIATKKIVIQK